MLDTNLLKAEIVRNGYTQGYVADKLGITDVTFSKKMRTGTFGLLEAEEMIKLLHIENPGRIFFGEQ